MIQTSRAATARSPWFPFRRAAEPAQLRLFCMPPAAGSASGYRPWFSALAPDIEVVPVQPPGRESRLAEQPVRRAADLAGQIADAVGGQVSDDRIDGPYALFGHSMGALLAYEVACLLAARGLPAAHLVVSGHLPAHLIELKPVRTNVSRMSDGDLRGYLAEQGGTGPDVLDNPELMAILLPLLRADLTVCESYRWTPRPPLPMPVTALGGDADPNVAPELLVRWSELTIGGFGMRILPGGHHYLYADVGAMTAVVAGVLLGPAGREVP
jgi:surfactin synthase thioesterase subunit